LNVVDGRLKTEGGGPKLQALHTYSKSAMTQPPVHPEAALAATKATAWAALQRLPGPGFAASCRALLTPDVLWVASHPVNELIGPEAVADRFFAPLMAALPDLERRTDLFFGGHWDGHICGGAGQWVTCIGHYLGTFSAPLFGIPANGQPVWLRFGEFYRIEGGRIAEARVLLDLVDLARQAGHALLPPSSGRDILVPGPLGHDGLLLGNSDPAQGQACLDLVLQMIGGLSSYNQSDLKSMGMTRFWHPQMMWYGPCGIGTTRAISGFEEHHQRPFLTALPDRKGGHHRVRLGEGNFAASTGWPSIHATQRGPYLGVPASNKAVTMRVMDWWRADAGLLVENWVLLDLPHFFLQLDVDILARVAR
jgi:SnoaL-like polyketide cyclase/SnoaL-like domain